ncbi:sigma-70 family RNA polymerase sigma factor [Parahaliea mediterranea]|uniref:Sigma-70 family RNA polymerase sigma factor n=1 Tax=Parahaliea mediterranea TaxID=651086 RepID=A0A939IJH0_9GAMM|nr:sigma-70 family RNA polymerase sigma factor [Parahaliea mediterranea]MBN7797654.1 sigma-70 family RNA polymerase sigma factor [Parahaliea mediterranea]
MTQWLSDFEAHRSYLTNLAYRMLGSVAEAEDVVQDAWLRLQGGDGQGIDNPRGYLVTVVSRLALDRLKSARHQREVYIGPWLPEPVLEAPGPGDADMLARDVSYALMLALERLSPLERAAFLLHDVFDMSFAEVAASLGRSEAGCRQLASRARRHVHAARPRFSVPEEDAERLADAFFTASRQGDTAVLSHLLAEGANLHTDGGGKRPAALRVIVGADKVCRFYAGLLRKRGSLAARWQQRSRINGMPGVLSVEQDGLPQATALGIDGGRITDIYVMRNPAKLRHLHDRIPDWAMIRPH